MSYNVGMTTNTTQTDTKRMKRISAGLYEDGTYGIRRIEDDNCHFCGWMTYEIERAGNTDGGWMQTYWTLRDAKEGIAWCHANEEN